MSCDAQVIVYYLLPLFLFDFLVPRRHLRLPAEAPSVDRVASEVVLMLLVYDLCFSLGHLCLHKIPWLHRRVHAVHHSSRVTRAMDTVRVSFPEQVQSDFPH